MRNCVIAKQKKDHSEKVVGFCAMAVVLLVSLKIKRHMLYRIRTTLLIRYIAEYPTSLLPLLSICIYFLLYNSEKYDHAQSDFSTGLSLTAPSVTVINLASFALAE